MAFPDTPLSTPLFAAGFVNQATMDLNVTTNFNLLATRVADTGWQSLTLLTGFTGSAVYKIVGTHFELDGTIVRTAGAFSTTATTVATIPAGGVPLRQQQRLIAGAVSASTVGAVELLIGAGSTALQLQQGPGTAGTVWLGNIVWAIA